MGSVFCRRLAAIVCLAGLWAAAPADVFAADATERPIHFSHLQITPPAGWTHVESGGWLIFTPPDVPAGQQVWLGISPGGDSSRDLTEEFGALMAASAHGMTAVQPGTPVYSTDAQGLKNVSQLVVLQDAAGRQYTRLYIARRNGGRFESLAFSSSDPALSKKYVEDLKAAVNSMVFDGAPPPVAAANPPATPTPPPPTQNTPPAAANPGPNRDAAAGHTPGQAAAPDTAKPASAIPSAVGAQIDVLWGTTWWPATVVKVDGEKREIHYDGYGDGSNEWVTPDRIKLRGAPPPPGAATVARPAPPAPVERPKTLSFPTRLGAPAIGEVLHAQDKNGQWYMATVLKTDGEKRLVSFHGWDDPYNEWVGPEKVKPLTPEEVVQASQKHTLDGWFAKTEIFVMTGNLKFTTYWFGKDGTCYAGMPADGVLATDFATLQKTDPKNCGEYQFIGTQLTIRKADGQTESHTLSGTVMDGRGVLQRASRFADGATLNAAYSFSVSSTFGGVHAAAGGNWTFTNAGTFEHSSFAGTETVEAKGIDGGKPGDARHVGSSLTKGTYKFANGQLVLTDAAGQTETHGVFGIGDMKDPYLILDGQLFNRH